MKITVWGINYAPEPTGIAPYNTDLCNYLQERGHEVRMVTGFPYYPTWQKSKKDQHSLYRREEQSGVEVHRCWQYVPKQPKALSRIFHEATFILTSFLRLLFLPRPDLLIVMSPPLPLGPAAWLLGLLKRCPFLFHVQDMQPDAAVSLGLLQPGALTRLLYRIEHFTYSKAAVVSGITQGMLDMFTQKGVPQNKQLLWPNWIIGDRKKESVPELPPGSFRRKEKIGNREFLVVYSGNLGKKQGLDIVLDAAETLARRAATTVTFVIAGEGAAAGDLRRQIEEKNLPVRLLPLQDEPMFQAMLQDADLCLVTQMKGSGALFFPSKLITILSAGRPVVTVADEISELAKAVQDGGFGRNVLPGESHALAAAIAALAADRNSLPALGYAGREWIQRFARENVLEMFALYIEGAQSAPETRFHKSLSHKRK